MPGFVSPLSDLAGWTLSPVPQIEIPKALRYGGIMCRGLRAERVVPAEVLMPAPGVLRKVSPTSTSTVVEVQVNPFQMRDLVGAIPFGLPTFYLFFEPAPPLTFADGDIETEGAALASVRTLTLVQIGQDRIVRDPAEWAREITAAIPNPDTGPASWQAFANAVAASLNSNSVRPILILDHRGRLAKNPKVSLVLGPPASETVQNIDLTEADGGDLQAALRRLGLPDNPLASGGAVRLRQRSGDVQFVRIEDRASSAGEVTLSIANRHIQFTDLQGWFAEQFAIPEGQAASPLSRYTRGNRMTPFVNGKPFYRTFFDLLLNVDGPKQGVHLTGGFTLEAEANLLELPPDDARPKTLKEALERIKGNFGTLENGGGRFLAAKFIQIEPDETLSDKEIAAFYFLVGVIGAANIAKLGLTGLKTDGSGFAIVVLIALLHHFLVKEFVDQNGKPIEPMREAIDLLDDPELRSLCKFSPLPTTVADNPLAPTGFPFDTLFPFIRHFGLYHQKIAVIKNRDEGGYGFCGGIDMNPNRVDDADHNVSGPYHDVHTMVEGKAVVDVATTFEQRWARDGGRDENGNPNPLAFAVADINPPETTGDDVVQVARTYPHVLDTTQRLAYAPFGDRTILDTTLNAIRAAKEYIHIEDQYFTPPREYVDAIVERVASGELRKLIITLPTSSDQPFGDLSQANTINAFREAETAAGAAPGEIVKIGILRRHFTVASNTLRAASGKLILGEDMSPQAADPGFDDTIVLGPKVRAPIPPFWIAVEGELMWAYDEAPVVVHGEPPEGTRRFSVDRGQRTRLFGLGTGAKPRKHEQGAAATVVNLSGIFVHAKLIMVDDVFAGIGSANVNRRGFYSDGEGHFFWVPERLKAKPPAGTARTHNPIARLRHEIWAELLNLPYPMAAPLLDDPVAAAALFDRLPIHGNRFTPKDAIPQTLAFGTFNGGDSIIALVLQALFSTIVGIDHKAIFEGVADPTTNLEPLP
jgi:phosphatidylserine/phosphatidylglycerophosphate/cardiolipin synthase-like enzyme